MAEIKRDENGNVILTEGQYNNLLNFQQDMHKYKERMKAAESGLTDVEANKKEVANLKTENQKLRIDNALKIAGLQAGIKNVDDISLIKDIEIDSETDINDACQAIISNLKTERPYLFSDGSEAQGTPVDTGLGGQRGPLSDEDLAKLPAKKIEELKKARSPLFDRWMKLRPGINGQPTTPAMVTQIGGNALPGQANKPIVNSDGKVK
jgi:hypothetical protein